MNNKLIGTMIFTLIAVITGLTIINAPIPGAFSMALIISVVGISGGKNLLPLLLKYWGM